MPTVKFFFHPNYPLISLFWFIPYFSTFQFRNNKNKYLNFLERFMFLYSTIFDSRREYIWTSNIEIRSLFSITYDPVTIFKNQYRSWYISTNFSEIQIRSLSLSLFLFLSRLSLSSCLSRWGVAYENRDYGREEIQRNRSKLTGTDDDIEDVALCR